MSDLTPPSGEPEYLDSQAGTPLAEPGGEPAAPRSRRRLFIAGGAVGALAVAGGATWAAMSFLSAGPDAAEALPASTTIAFASINLDPSGEQKIEALQTLKKFPGLKDKLNFDTADDVRKHIFEEIQKSGECDGVDYAADVEPWLGDRMAVAAVDGGQPTPSPVVVVQVTDEDKAKAGLDKIESACQSPGSSDETAFAFEDGWAVVAETQEIADKVVADTASASLADDETYQHWLDESGETGIATLYAAPKAGQAVMDAMESDSGSPFGSQPMPQSLSKAFTDFKGAGGVVRFHDGALETELAGDWATLSLGLGKPTTAAGEIVSSLPSDTAFAYGMSLPHGWLQYMADAFSSGMGTGMTSEDLFAEAEKETGLTLPEDVETLLGDGFVVAASSNVDLETLINSGDATGLEVGVKVKGDAAAANAVLDKIRPQLGPQAYLLGSKDSDGFYAVGPNSSYLDSLLNHGGLADSSTFKDVVPHADEAVSVVYLDFDAGDNWLVNALKDGGAPAEVTDNVDPLSAFGMSVWLDGDVSHSLLKITTD